MFNFFGDGGFPGGGHGHGGMGGGPKEDVDTDKFYNILGVGKDASANDIKKAYRKLAMKHHPDKGGDADKFKEITRAHEILSDPEKKSNYDKYGEKGIDGGPGGMDAGDIFSSFFGGGGGGGGRRGPKKGKDVRFRLAVELADLYNGGTKKLRLTKSIICAACKGAGGANVRKCPGCKGSGVRVYMRQLGPGMVQQIQAHCDDCGGEGEIMSAKDRCKECAGEKIQKVKKTLEVHINAGMRNGEKVVFRGESDESPGLQPGDVIVELECKKHPLFVRQGDHLFLKKKITLLESLTGFSFSFEHLDGRIIKVQTQKNQITPHESFKLVQDEGFPTHRNKVIRGNLYIEFLVQWPESLNPKAANQLKDLLPGPDASDNFVEEKDGAEVEEVRLEDVNMEQERRRMKQEAQMHGEDDDDEDGGPQQASCRAQ